MTEREQNRLYQCLGDRLRQHRRAASLSQLELGDLIGRSRSSIVNIEKGRQRPPLHVIWEVAEVLGVNLEDLIPSKDEVEVLNDVDSELESRIADEIGDSDPETVRRIAEFIQTSQTGK